MGRRITGATEHLQGNLARLKMGKQIITDNFVNVLNQGLDQKIGAASSDEITTETSRLSKTGF